MFMGRKKKPRGHLVQGKPTTKNLSEWFHAKENPCCPDKEAQNIMSAAEDTHTSGSKEELISKIKSLRKQVKRLQLERDVLKGVAEILKKARVLVRKSWPIGKRPFDRSFEKKPSPERPARMYDNEPQHFFTNASAFLQATSMKAERRIKPVWSKGQTLRVPEDPCPACARRNKGVHKKSSGGAWQMFSDRFGRKRRRYSAYQVRKHLPPGTCTRRIYAKDRTLNGLPTSRSFRSLQARSTLRTW